MGGFVRKRKGTISVFLCLALVGAVSAGLVFAYAAREASLSSRADAVIRLAGRSVMAEYDTRLKDRYSLLAFYGLGEDVEDKLEYYISHSISSKDMGEIKADMSSGSLKNTAVFEEALISAIKREGLSELRDFISERQKEKNEGKREGRTLKSSAEKNSLPSKDVSGGGFIENFSNVKDLAGLINGSAEEVLIGRYIVTNFNYNYGCGYAEQGFFENEVEYVLFGKYSDDQNMARTKAAFVALRTVLNVAHIYSDEEKLELVLAASEATGPFAGLTQAVIVSGWGAAEAFNDWKLVTRGEKVPIVKTADNWALSLENAANSPEGEGDCIYPVKTAGLSYEEYLQIFLCMMGKEKKLARVMDLMQLNLRATYYPDFLIKNYNTGFSFEAVVNGKKYAYEERY